MAVDIVENLRIKTRERGRVHAENEDGDERVIHFDLEKVKGMQEGKELKTSFIEEVAFQSKLKKLNKILTSF